MITLKNQQASSNDFDVRNDLKLLSEYNKQFLPIFDKLHFETTDHVLF